MEERINEDILIIKMLELYKFLYRKLLARSKYTELVRINRFEDSITTRYSEILEKEFRFEIELSDLFTMERYVYFMFIYFLLEDKRYVNGFKFELKHIDGDILRFYYWTERKKTILNIVKNLTEMSINCMINKYKDRIFLFKRKREIKWKQKKERKMVI